MRGPAVSQPNVSAIAAHNSDDSIVTMASSNSFTASLHVLFCFGESCNSQQ